MARIMYNYPAMLAYAADMSGYADTLQSLGADIAAEQAALAAGWQGYRDDLSDMADPVEPGHE